MYTEYKTFLLVTLEPNYLLAMLELYSAEPFSNAPTEPYSNASESTEPHSSASILLNPIPMHPILLNPIPMDLLALLELYSIGNVGILCH